MAIPFLDAGASGREASDNKAPRARQASLRNVQPPAQPDWNPVPGAVKIAVNMRATLSTPFLLVSIAALSSMIGISGCGSSAKKAQEEAAKAQAEQQATVEKRAQFKKRCGDPVHFPVSDECVRLADDQGPSLRRRSDLTVAVWRACALIPSAAETIRQELVAKGSSKTSVGQKLIGEMERTEQHSDSPCVVADLSDLDCVAGNSETCESVRNANPECIAWLNDNDTQARLKCINRAVHNPACVASASAQDSEQGGTGAANYFSDSPAQAEDCRRIEKACLHTFDECANAKDALAAFLKQEKTAPHDPRNQR
jgi:hypothetical protein